MPDSSQIGLAGPALTEPLAQFLDQQGAGLPSGLGGTPVWQLAQDLLERGQRVSVITLDPGVSTALTASGPLLDVTYGPYRPHRRMRDLMRVERLAVRDGVLRARPDIVHAHWCGEYALGALASGIPTLVTVRDWMPAVLKLMKARHWPYWSGRMLLYFATLAKARYLTANSPYTAGKVRRFTRASLEVVPNGMPDADFLASWSDQAGEQRQPNGSPPVIVSVNNGFGPLKNVQALLAAHGSIRQSGVKCELHLIGYGYEPAGPCEAWAQQMRLAEACRFLGPLARDEVLRRLRAATLLVHPSKEESFGMTLVEAMSQRTPVIGGARSGAVPWVLAGGNAGLLVDVDDSRAIARAIEAVLTASTLQRQLADDGFAHAWQNFRQSRVTDLYLDAYRRLLAQEVRR